MLRALLFVVKVGLLVAAAVWIAERPGTVHLQWLDYDIHVQVGFALLVLFVFVLLLLFLHRAVLGVAGLRRRWRARQAKRQAQKGMRALALGYSAVAAGDSKIADYQAYRARLLLPDDKGLSVLLNAQAARLRGDNEAACAAYEQLLQNKDTAFLGLRGLIAASAERGDIGAALGYARQARGLYPRSPWIIRTVYALEVRNGAWDAAWKTLGAAQKRGLIAQEQAESDRIAMHVARADRAQAEGKDGEALHELRRALRDDPGFVPAAVRLARLELGRKKRRTAAKIIEAAWRQNPHPALAALWAEAMPDKKPYDAEGRLRWFEKLVAMNPDSAESQMAAAQCALEERLWAEARQYLVMAERLAPSARLYRLWADYEDGQGKPEEARRYLDLAAEAPPDRVWTCKETGRIYERWSPVAEPHGSFNTIVWDYPRPGVAGHLPQDVTDMIGDTGVAVPRGALPK